MSQGSLEFSVPQMQGVHDVFILAANIYIWQVLLWHFGVGKMRFMQANSKTELYLDFKTEFIPLRSILLLAVTVLITIFDIKGL